MYVLGCFQTAKCLILYICNTVFHVQPEPLPPDTALHLLSGVRVSRFAASLCKINQQCECECDRLN